ncbi:MFS transporter [Streptomyces sp. NPDC060194]|uniref:MFS transporter n=1 Tax=Streptomyces sp. NPDC060194 TaxID=3347069 RepID=UPI00365DEFEF
MPATGSRERTRSLTSAAPPRSLLLRDRDFRSLWIGATTGKYGAAVTSVALPLIAVTLLHASTLQVGLLTAATWAPWLLIGLPAGAWVDRLPSRPVMLVSDAAALLLFVSIPVSAWLGVLSIGSLLVTALLVGTATVFFQTAYTTLLPRLIPLADRPEANSKLHGSESAAQLAGSGSGGFLVQALGAANGMFVTAATFAVSFVCVLRIRHREPDRAPRRTAHPADDREPERGATHAERPAADREPAPAPQPPADRGTHPAPARRPRGALAREIAVGLRLTFRDPYLRATTVNGAAANLALMAYQSVVVVFLVREVHLAAWTVGVLMTAGGFGGIAGAFAARRLSTRLGTARALLLFDGVVPALALLIPLTTPGAGLALYVLGSGAVSFGVVAGNTVLATFRQAYVPTDLLGRISASKNFVVFGTLPLGAVLGGALGELLGNRPALWIAVATLPLCALPLWLSPVRTRRDLPTRPAAAH